MPGIRKHTLTYLLVIFVYLTCNYVLSRLHAITHFRYTELFISGLLCFTWGQYIRGQIIHRRIRHNLLGISYGLTALFVARMCKYMFFAYSPAAVRFFWYLYYLPFCCVPLLSYQTALCIGTDEKARPPKHVHVLRVIAVLLGIFFLLNDKHHCLLIIEPDGSYRHGWGYALIVIWTLLLGYGGYALMLHRCRLSGSRAKWYIPILLSGIGALLLAWYVINGGSPSVAGVTLGNDQSACSLIFIGCWHGCSVIGLLQTNTGYRELFKHSHINAELKDSTGTVRYASEATFDRAANAYLLVRGKPILGGSMTWTEDVSAIRRLNLRLEDMNERIEEENELIEEENAVTAERTRYETQNRLYDAIAAHTHNQLSEISDALQDSGAAAENLPRSLLLGTYVKRCANLMLLANRSPQIPTDELLYSVRESLECLHLLGKECLLDSPAPQERDAAEIIQTYDLFEALIEQTAARFTICSVTVSASPELLLDIRMDAEPDGAALKPYLQDTGLLLTVTEEDGSYRICAGGGGSHA